MPVVSRLAGCALLDSRHYIQTVFTGKRMAAPGREDPVAVYYDTFNFLSDFSPLRRGGLITALYVDWWCVMQQDLPNRHP